MCENPHAHGTMESGLFRPRETRVNTNAAESSFVASHLPSHRRVPAWAMSLVLHAILFITFFLAFRVAQKGGPADAGRPVGVALVNQNDLRRDYVLSDQQVQEQTPTTTSQASVSAALPKANDIAIDLDGVLPSVDDALFGAGDVGTTSTNTNLEGASTVRPGMMGKTTTSVFGVSGTGSTFVYVFDRSASMKGRPLAAAKQQLKNSLRDLDQVHQFHIVFYNEAPRDFKYKGRTARLVFADDAGKSAAASFVDSISAVGATQHMPAISTAILMRPDVIFFLTDADEPQMTELELRKIRTMNRGATINAIQFGAGPQGSSDNFLARLARQNGGQHAYVDVTLLQSF